MKLLVKLLLGLVALVVLLLVIGFFLPGSYRVERSATINAKPEKIFPLINSLKRWPDWSAWNTTRYPDMTYNYTGPETGVGAESAWTGKSSGTGKMKLTKSDPAKGIEYDLDFENGQYLSTGALSFEPAGESTKVVWTTQGDLSGPVGHWMGLCMDRFMGPDFETGLANLKAKAEAK